jgi:hypothetical protein
MPWSDPEDWEVGQLVTAAKMNAQVRDNLRYLLNRQTVIKNINEAANYTTSSGTWGDVDSVDLSATLTPKTNYVKVGFQCIIEQTGASTGSTLLDITKDSVRVGGDDGLIGVRGGAITQPVGFTVKVPVTPGVATTFRIQWRTTNTGAVMYAGAGTSGLDVHPQFWVEEA